MFRDKYQRDLFTIFFSCGSKPLKLWDTYIQDGYITKLLDEDIKSTVLEIGGTNVSTTYMICPKGKQVLGITLPFMVMIVKNMKKYFSFEITILDDTRTRRRFRVSNFQSTTQISPLFTVMPIVLSDGWNQIQFNMSDFCRRAYQKQFLEVQNCKINANIRIRRIYFAERIMTEDKLPAEYKLFIPLKKKLPKDKPKTDAEGVALEKVPTTTKAASQVQEEKRSSKVLKKPPSLISRKSATKAAATEGAPDQTMATEVAPDQTMATEGAPDQIMATESAPDQAMATEEPVAVGEEPVATSETPATDEAATETTESVKETSVEAATQSEPVSVKDKAADGAEVGEKTESAGHLDKIEE